MKDVSGVGEIEYYVVLREVIELEHLDKPIKRVVLFLCKWFDPRSSHGTRVHPFYKIVKVNHSREYN